MQTESKSWKGSFLAEPDSLFQKVNMKGKMDLFPFSLGGHIYLLRMLRHNIRELPLCWRTAGYLLSNCAMWLFEHTSTGSLLAFIFD